MKQSNRRFFFFFLKKIIFVSSSILEGTDTCACDPAKVFLPTYGNNAEDGT
jgi:hypothetical protein